MNYFAILAEIPLVFNHYRGLNYFNIILLFDKLFHLGLPDLSMENTGD